MPDYVLRHKKTKDIIYKGIFDCELAFIDNAKLDKVDFSYADFTNWDLPGVDFSKTLLIGAVFDSADLQGADFSHAILNNTSFKYTLLIETNFTKAQLAKATFLECQMLKTSFQGAFLDSASFKDIGFDSVNLWLADLRYTSFENVKFDTSCLTLLCYSFNLDADDRLVSQLFCHFARLRTNRCSPVIRYAHRILLSSWPGSWLKNLFGQKYRINEIDEV